MKRVLHLVPHLSTGGCPQFAYDLVRKTKEYTDAYVVEYSFIAPDYVVQRNKVIELMGDRFFSINHNKEELIDLIARLNPDVIHFQEFPEYFMEDSIAEKIYRKERNYVIIETSHDSSFNPSQKRFFADHLALISQWQIDKFQSYGIPITLLQSDIEIYDEVDREVGLRNLGLDPEKEHVLNVGLWTSRKNQGEIVEYAKQLQGSHPNIQFHFVGNQAGNFAHYWEPIMKDLPANCKVWGERSDVHNFYSCMDLFLFTSRGLHGDMETSPLVLREATGHGMPILMYNLPVYLNQYDGFENIQYLDFDDLEKNLEDIKTMLGYSTHSEEYKNILNSFMGNNFDIGARYLEGELTEEELDSESFKVGEPFMQEEKKSNFYSQKNINKMFRADFHKDENKIFLYYKDAPYKEVSISVADVDSKHAIYAFNSKFENYSSLWTIPVPVHALNHYNRSGYFRGYEISIYETDRTTLIEKHVVWYNQYAPHFERVLFETDPWNLTWINYTEMFVEDFYNPLAMNIHGVCLDIGANDGLYTEYLLRNGAEKVYAIECDPRSVKFLNKRFNSDERVVVVDKALFSKNEVGMKLAYKNETSTTSSLIEGVHNFDDGQYYEVNAWDYSTLLRKMNIDQVDFFKIDIEGAEYDVFRSMTDFQICHIKAFMVEIHWNRDGRIYEITNRLQSLGYEIQLRRHTEDNAVVENRDEWARYDLCTFYAWKRNDDEELPIVQIVEEDPQDEINIHISHLRTTLNTDVEKQSLENIRGLSEYLMQDSRINFVHLTEFENEPYSDIPPRENCARPNAVSMRAFPNGINEHGQTALTPAHYGCYDAFRKAFLHETEHHSNIGFDLNIFFEGDAYVDDYKLFADCLVDFYRAIDDINNQLAYASFGGIYHLETGELLSERSGQIHGIDWGYFSKHVPFAHSIIIPQWYMVWMREAFRNEPWDVADLFFMNHFRNHPEHKQFVSKSQIARQLNGFSLIDKKVKQYLNK